MNDPGGSAVGRTDRAAPPGHILGGVCFGRPRGQRASHHMSSHSLTILMPRTSEQRYSCHSCAGCCHDFTVQLRAEDVARLDEQKWEQRLGQSPIVHFRGRNWLRQREDGACIFLQEDGRCRIHGEFGLEQKPLACQMFPFVLAPGDKGIQVGLSYACPSMINNRGAELSSHTEEVRRMARLVPEVRRARPRRVMLNARIEATGDEEQAVVRAMERLMGRVDLPMVERLDGAAWLTGMLRQAKLEAVRGKRLNDLLDLLLDSFEEEIAAAPPQWPAVRQLKVLRQMVFVHVEDVKISEVQGRGIGVRALTQFRRHHAFGRGRGDVPPVGRQWPALLRFEMVDGVTPASDDDGRGAIDFLLLRYVRSRIMGGRAWGSGYYGFSIIAGLEALWMMLAATGWLARLHAGADGRAALTMADVQAALLRTDRAAGRAPWLGSRGERLRLAWLAESAGIRSLLHAMRLTDEAGDEEEKDEAGDSPDVASH